MNERCGHQYEETRAGRRIRIPEDKIHVVHPGRGLVAPDEYREAHRASFTSDLLRRLLGG